jgi:hypothetical protein
MAPWLAWIGLLPLACMAAPQHAEVAAPDSRKLVTLAMITPCADALASGGAKPFQNCDNILLLTEQPGVGATGLKRIELRGVPIEQAIDRFDN